MNAPARLPDDTFVNPYTFVPFPDGADVTRGRPPGHAALPAGHYSGRLTVTATARTPILTGRRSRNEPPLLPSRPGLHGRRDAIVPGSSLAGAVRSLHETLAGGCLRVFEREFLPTYRDIATPDAATGLALGLVTEIDGTGRPTAAWVCDEVVWMDVSRLPATPMPRTGMLLRIDDLTTSTDPFGRTEGEATGFSVLTDPVPGAWVVMLGDSRPRGAATVFRVALGCLPAEATSVQVETAWPDYVRCALDADDMRGRRKDENHLAAQRAQEPIPLTNRVTWHGGLVGERQLVRPWVQCGSVLWLTHDGDVVTELRAAVLWRHTGGEVTAGERVDPQLIPCADPTQLCPSCRIFGSADVEGRADDEAARQRSYAGHVRFTDLVPATRMDPDGGELRELAPLSSPHAGAGQFYLDNCGRPRLPQAEGELVRDWGSTNDQPRRRALRGRKYYWPTSTTPDVQRWKRRAGHTNEDVLVSGRTFPFGKRFTTTVWFDGLDLAALGGLLAALRPSLVLTAGTSHHPHPAVCLPLGGGKPFGFGALETTVQLDRLESAGSRYGAEDAPRHTVQDAVAAFVADVPPALHERVWPALSAVLTLDHVQPRRVWYPPGTSWAGHRPDDPNAIKSFDDGFEFWKNTRGERLRQARSRPLLPLPDPAAGDAAQQLPIVGRA